MSERGVSSQATGLRDAQTCPKIMMRLLCAAAAMGVPAQATQAAPEEAPLAPDAPLAPMPDIGGDWPDLGDLPPEQPLQDQPARPTATVLDGRAQRQYSIALDGVDRIADPTGLVESFEQQ